MARKRTKTAKNMTLRGDIWYFRRVNPTTKKREMVSTECKDLDQAKRRKTELEKKQNDDAFGWTKKAVQKEVPTVDTWARMYRTTYLPKQKSPGGFAQALTHVANKFGDRGIDTITAHDGEELMAELRAEGYAESSLRTYHTALRTIWGKAKTAKFIDDNPWKLFKMPVVSGRRRVLTLTEQPKLLGALRPVWRRAVMFVILTGLRRHELTRIVDTDIDFVLRRMRVLGKGNKERYVPLVPEAIVILREQIAARDARALDTRILKSIERRIQEGRLWPFGKASFYETVSATATALKFSEPLTAHDLRRTFGSRCAATGVSMKKLQEWMGHSDISITAKFYVHTDSTTDDRDMAGLRASVPAWVEETEQRGVVTEMATVERKTSKR